MSVDVLPSGKSVFSLFYVCLFDQLFSLHVFFGDTEDFPSAEKAKLKYRIALFFLVSN